jgi:polar amino acid transport system substrate-binding protein
MLAVLWSSNSYAESLRLVTENLPPLQIIQQDGTPAGAMVDIVNLLLKETSLDGKIEIYPWARSYQIALAEKNTLIFSMFRDKSRENKFQWIGNLLTVSSYLVALKTSKSINISSIEDAKPYSVGSIRQDLAEHYLKEHGFEENKNLYLSSDYSILWQMLFNGRTHLAFTNDVMWQHELKDVGLDVSQINFVYKIPNFASDLYLAASLDTDKKTVHKLTKALKKIKANGQYQAILEKWRINLKSPINN